MCVSPRVASVLFMGRSRRATLTLSPPVGGCSSGMKESSDSAGSGSGFSTFSDLGFRLLVSGFLGFIFECIFTLLFIILCRQSQQQPVFLILPISSFQSLRTPQSQMQLPADPHTIIIGGGIAGLAAARTLDPHLPYLLLQAGPQLCGRIQSVRVDGRRIDTGAYELASFSQQRKEENKLYKAIREGLCGVEQREDLGVVYYYDSVTGGRYEQAVVDRMETKVAEIAQLAQKMTVDSLSLSVQQIYAQYKKDQVQVLSESEHRLLELLLVMEQQEQAGDPHEIAADTFFAQGEMEEDCLDAYPLPVGGYHALVQNLAMGLDPGKVHLGARVTRVVRESDGCRVLVKQEGGVREYSCQSVICAVPLTVLKKGEVVFEPELPETHRFVIDKLQNGYMEKIIIAFEQPFWPSDAQRLKIAFPTQQRGKYAHFSNLSGPRESGQGQAHILCCYVTASNARTLLSTHSQQQIIEQVVAHLQSTFPAAKISPIDYHITNWQQQPHVNFSFSFIGPELRYETALRIRESVEGRVWLAGEYCYPENIGCAHGAYETGARAALEILARGVQQ